MILIHSIGAFILAPLYAFFINYTEAPKIYFYLGVSYSVFFPLYGFLSHKIHYLREKFIYLFFAHLFGITFLAFQSLTTNKFQYEELFCFYGLFTVCGIMIQRWYPLILYNSFVFLLLTYGLFTNESLSISPELTTIVFSTFGLTTALVLFARLSINKHQQKQYNHLKAILNNSGIGYVLFNIKKGREIIEASDSAIDLFNTTGENLNKVFFSLLNNEDFNGIRKLNLGLNYVKNSELNRFENKQQITLDIAVVFIDNQFNYLARIKDNTENVERTKEQHLLEKKYKNLYFKNNAGVFTLDKKAQIINCNPSFIEMFENNLNVGDGLFSADGKKEWDIIIESLGNAETSQKYQTQFFLSKGVEKTLLFNWYFDVQTETIEGTVIDLTNIQKASRALQQSEEKYRLIYEDSNDAILLLDGDKIIDLNRKTSQLFGLTQDELLNRELYSLSANKKAKSIDQYNLFKSHLNNRRSTKFNWVFIGNNSEIETEVSLIEIILGKNLYYQCVIKDNTDQNKRIRTIKKNNKNLENILENNPEGILIVRDEKILYANSEIVKMIAKPMVFEGLFNGKEKIKFQKTYQEHLKKKKRENIQLRLVDGNFKERLVDTTIVSTVYEEEEASLIIIKDISAQNILEKEKLRAELAEESNKKLANEIRERIKTERLLEEQFIRTKAILDSSSNTLLLTLTTNETISSYNTHCENYFLTNLKKKIKQNEPLINYLERVMTPVRLRLFKILFSEVKKGKSRQFEVRLELKNKEFWLEIFMNPIFDTRGNVAELSIVAHDISEKKKSSIKIESSLKEKEVLLKEIHHRVKNNLQVISSILNLQSSFIDDEKTLEILQESRNRIRSMAIIHENLYRTEDFSSINFSSYLENLTSNLIPSYSVDDSVSLQTNLNNINLSLDQAIPCGLLVNEIITNALKYAWKKGEKGKITINLKQKEKIVYLEISDDGIGLPANFKNLKTDTLGLQLVATLVEQLDGDIRIETTKGTKYLIKFENIKPESYV